MLIIDSQVHIWAADTPARPWPKPGVGGRTAKAHLDIPISKDSLLAEMDKAGVDGVVIVPPSWEGEYNDLALEAAQSHPNRFAVMGRILHDQPDGPSLIANWKSQQGMLGVRLILADGSPWVDAGSGHWLWSSAEAAGVPITLAPRGNYGFLEEIAERYPDLRLSIDHMGANSAKKDGDAFIHLEQLLQLATYPNIAVKTSGLPCVSSSPYPFESVHGYLRQVYDAFGPKRMFWGTDLSRLPCSYTEAITMFTQGIPWLSAADLEWIMGRAICEWFGWKRTA